ncbi:MAG: chromosome partitioning protein ParA [Parcubacteria group bacterium]|mgnify:CR=1 FL=1|nr:chromosome partitioning protein ParA [Parcubacteria group bacterium]|tara:strand:+ start:1958 stop:2728 length:771 start_codon:yes stop_codon:yes gene_type:complete
MSRIISVVNQKGGVGKTTTSINLGAFLAHMGKSVLLVDLDPQANASAGLGINHKELEFGIYHCLIGEVRMPEIIRNTSIQGYRVAPSTPDLAGASVELVNADRREFRLADALDEVKHGYDYILIDCPPSLGMLTINGLIASDEVLIPVQAEYYALEGLGQLMNTIKLVKEHIKPELKILGTALTMYDKRNKLSTEVMHELYKFFPDKIFRSVIPRAVRLAEAPSFGQSILEYDPRSKASSAYHRLAKEIAETQRWE